MLRAKMGDVAPLNASLRLGGDVQSKWLGEWQVGRSYAPLDKVSRDGSSFVCVRPCASVDPLVDVGDGVEGECWLLIAKGGRNGVDGTVAFEKLTEEQRESLKGDRGLQGNSVVDIKKDAGDVTGKTLSIYVKDYAQNVTAIYNIQMPDGPKGKEATINGVNALTIQAGDGIDVTMSGSTLTIKAKTVEEWTFTVEGEDGVDTTVTKKVVLV